MIFSKNVLICLVVFAPALGFADAPTITGFGAMSAGLGGISVSTGTPAQAAYLSPARLVETGDDWQTFVGFHGAGLSLEAEGQIQLENSITSDTTVLGTTAKDYESPTGITVGLSGPLPNLFGFKPTLGVNAYVPWGALASLDSGPQFQPNFFLYRSRLGKPFVQVAIATPITTNIFVGLGTSINFGLEGATDVTLKTLNTQASSMRLRAQLKPVLAPVLSIYYDQPDFGIGATVRFPSKPTSRIEVSANAAAFGDLSGIPLRNNANGGLVEEPWVLEFGGKYLILDTWTAHAQVDFQAWGSLSPPWITLEADDLCRTDPTKCAGLQFSYEGPRPEWKPKNIAIPRLGLEKILSDKWTVRMGYAYVPAAIDSAPNGNGNQLDLARHQLGLGASHPLSEQVTLHGAAVYAAYSALSVAKTAGDESGNSAGTKVGAPGYRATGNLWTLQVDATVKF